MCAIIDDYQPKSCITQNHLIDLVRQIDLLHSSGHVHGDLKAPNIVFSDNEKAVLIDFDRDHR